jgi:hypothetical protein
MPDEKSYRRQFQVAAGDSAWRSRRRRDLNFSAGTGGLKKYPWTIFQDAERLVGILHQQALGDLQLEQMVRQPAVRQSTCHRLEEEAGAKLLR